MLPDWLTLCRYRMINAMQPWPIDLWVKSFPTQVEMLNTHINSWILAFTVEPEKLIISPRHTDSHKVTWIYGHTFSSYFANSQTLLVTLIFDLFKTNVNYLIGAAMITQHAFKGSHYPFSTHLHIIGPKYWSLWYRFCLLSLCLRGGLWTVQKLQYQWHHQ